MSGKYEVINCTGCGGTGGLSDRSPCALCRGTGTLTIGPLLADPDPVPFKWGRPEPLPPIPVEPLKIATEKLMLEPGHDDALRVLDDLRLWLTEAIRADWRRSQDAKGEASALALAGGVGGFVAARRKLNELDPRIGVPIDFGGSLTSELPAKPPVPVPPAPVDHVHVPTGAVREALAHLYHEHPDLARNVLGARLSLSELRQLGEQLDRLSMICFELASSAHHAADDDVTLPPEIAERIRAVENDPTERLHLSDGLRVAFDRGKALSPDGLYFAEFSRYAPPGPHDPAPRLAQFGPPPMTATELAGLTAESTPPVFDFDGFDLDGLGEDGESEEGPRSPERELPQSTLMHTLPDGPDVSGDLVDVTDHPEPEDGPR